MSGTETLYCSFCSKPEHEVRTLIKGPNVYICNECVSLCVDIVHEMNPSEKESRQARAMRRERAMMNIRQSVQRILKDEDKRHKPYVDLQSQLTAYEAFEEPEDQSGPATIKDFPGTPTPETS